MPIQKKPIPKGDLVVLKKTISGLLEGKKEIDSILEGLHGIPMNVDRLADVCYTIRSISNDMEFCAAKITDIIAKKQEDD